MDIDREVRIAGLDLTAALLGVAGVENDAPIAATLEHYLDNYALAVLVQARRIAAHEVTAGLRSGPRRPGTASTRPAHEPHEKGSMS
jgi:hypothetical protein